ncbi:undecaprenyl-phosphate alpha-N-acetylglucosaminyl 1-phosphate transferase [Bacillus sp. VT-16-64]|nr:undecaprenyl-phosphate alpha-N-acetylglucosaminyl 1-phosphate transferase [Bacillus sp. VT-16-64]
MIRWRRKVPVIYVVPLICFIISIALTPAVKRLAYYWGAIDQPNQRKIHQKPMPLLGGLAIFASFLAGVILVLPFDQRVFTIVVGGVIIVMTGILDDMLQLPPHMKLLGQIAAGGVVIYGGLVITELNIPFGGQFVLGFVSVPITLLWVVGITNAINLIDGLDGLAAGVSAIAFSAITFMAFLHGDFFVLVLGLICIGSTLGFLVYNFYPAKMFMGDTGALFLGYMIAVLSLLGFKSVTFISFIIPIIMLGVPISDTLFAIIRRILHKKPIAAPDKAHLHHCLLLIGFSHRQAVLLIYAIAALFSLAGIIFSMATAWLSIVILCILIIALQIFAEALGLVGENYKPLLTMIRRK